jgi:ubiquinone/menaquinone biosynthesis C-methylase UbiE
MAADLRDQNQLDSNGQPLVQHGPHPFILEMEPYLAPGSRIADVGSFSGDNGLYLANKGHDVAFIDIGHDALVDGVSKAKTLGSTATATLFIEGDARHLMFPNNTFDAVISTHVLQMLPKADTRQALIELRRITKPGGLNAVKVYAGTDHEVDVRPKFAIFAFGALKSAYESAGWSSLDHQEYHNPPASDYDGVSSYTKLVARKPFRLSPVARTYMNANRQLIDLSTGLPINH